MAVYTEVSDEDLRLFLDEYDIGEVASYKGIDQDRLLELAAEEAEVAVPLAGVAVEVPIEIQIAAEGIGGRVGVFAVAAIAAVSVAHRVCSPKRECPGS